MTQGGLGQEARWEAAVTPRGGTEDRLALCWPLCRGSVPAKPHRWPQKNKATAGLGVPRLPLCQLDAPHSPGSSASLLSQRSSSEPSRRLTTSPSCDNVPSCSLQPQNGCVFFLLIILLRSTVSEEGVTSFPLLLPLHFSLQAIKMPAVPSMMKLLLRDTLGGSVG